MKKLDDFEISQIIILTIYFLFVTIITIYAMTMKFKEKELKYLYNQSYVNKIEEDIKE